MEYRGEERGRARPGRREFRTDGDLRERSTGELLKEFFEDGQVLVREEIRIARAEMKEEAKKAARGGAAFGVGGVLLNTALLTFSAFLVAVGWSFLPLWLSALIVTVIWAIAGGAALLYGRERMKRLEPESTVRSLKEDKVWAKDTMQSIRSHRHANA